MCSGGGGGGLVLLLLWTLVCLSAAPADADGAFVWRGFSHAWERRVAGLETPHRISGFSNNIQNQTHSELVSQAQGNVRFSPGVDGDYAHPQIFFSALYSADVVSAEAEVPFRWTDNATHSSDPEARSTLSQKISLNFPSGASGAQVLLRGFSMDVFCDPAKQPPGDVCNSNGMWPFRWNMEVGECSPVSPAGQVDCVVDLEIFRAWNPADVPPVEKPFNYRLDFDVTLFLTGLASSPGVVSESSFVPTSLGKVTAEASIQEGIQEGRELLRGNPELPKSLVGMTGFGFELLETDFLKKRGRYLESLVFSVEVMDSQGVGESALQWRMGFAAPVTVFPCKAQYWMSPVLLQFSDHARVSMLGGEASAPVCDDGHDILFRCSWVGLENQTNNTVLINV